MNSAAKDVRDRGEPQKGSSGLVSRCLILCLFVLLLAASSSEAQMYTPVNIRCGAVIHDEYGNILAGSSAIDASKRNLVQIYWASNSVINPPDYDGLPHPNNAPVAGGRTAIGNLVSPALLMPGRFSAALASPRPPQNSRIFVRVFNAPTVEESSFYADSQLLQVKDNNVLVANIGDTVNPLDPRDDDGDGLNNSWEKSLGTDPNHWDTDGDGVSDHHEFLAGTDGLDEESFFAAVSIAPDSEGHAVLRWASVPGKQYIVQCMDPTVPDWLDYEDVSDVITAHDFETQTTIPHGMTSGRAMYRVRLVIGD